MDYAKARAQLAETAAQIRAIQSFAVEQDVKHYIFEDLERLSNLQLS